MFRARLITALGLAAVLAACSSSDGSTGPGPTPTAVTVQTGNAQTGAAGAALPTTLAVLVTDRDNRPVANRRVDWDVSAGSGTVSPTSSTTDSRGIATTVWTLGTIAGPARVTAQVNGVNPATFTATVLPGAPASVVATPDVVFLGVGDTLRVRATVRDAFGNEVTGQSITYTAADAAIASVSGTGLITAVAQGSARVIAAAGARADTVPVTVGEAGSGACGPIAPRVLNVGEVWIPSAAATGVQACITSPSAINAEYALTLINTGTSFGTSVTTDVVGIGNTGPLTAALRAPLDGLALPTDALTLDGQAAALSQEDAFELRRREVERRELTPLVPAAREWMELERRTASNVTPLNVGDEIRLNANPNVACTNPDNRTARVAAVGTNAIVVSDKDNPEGGYTDAEFQSVLATFDTLVYPMDTTAFGAPSNISKYGKILLFYTRAVNALTPPGANFTIGGYFFARDLYPRQARNNLPACQESNEQEMMYLLVPDPNGTVNGNRRNKTDVTRLNLTTIAHELQHLINSSRRLYVNVGAATNETVWLDEGLSHLAEELLFFRISGLGSRQNVSLSDITGPPRNEQFSFYASQNFSRFYSYLLSPETNSPYAPNDSLATRGAIWNFLRFAAARQGAAGEATFLRQLVNSTTTGVANLQNVLSGGAFADYLRDWSINLIADDFSAATTAALGAQYTNPAWNFRAIFPGLRFSGGAALGVYPIAARTLTSNSPQRITLAGGTSSHVRFGVPAGRSALLSLSSNGGAPAGGLRYGIVRLR